MNDKVKIISIIGTRPEAIKLFPLIKGLKKNSRFNSKVCVTGQHRDMVDQMLNSFSIEPDFDLDVMKNNQTLFDISKDILSRLEPILVDEKPDWLVVQGDTTSAYISALSAFYLGIRVAHVEAGLRTNTKKSPFPEEINRRMIGQIADLHFSPTTLATKNLLKENIMPDNIHEVGNTVIDAVRLIQEMTVMPSNGSKFCEGERKILITLHRRENHGDALINVCEAVKHLSINNPGWMIIWPIHPSPRVNDVVRKILSGLKNVILSKPLPYEQFIYFMGVADLILTDSGGIQEEASYTGQPVLIMREETERMELVSIGQGVIVGSDKEKIISEVEKYCNYSGISKKRSRSMPFGDGYSVERIMDVLSNS